MFLDQAQERLKLQGVKGKLEVHKDRWFWRGYCSVDGGPKKQQRLPLALPAEDDNLFLAEERVRALWGRYNVEGTVTRPLPWEIKALEGKQVITVATATAALREQFFRKKPVNASTLSSWKRLANEMHRMRPDQELTMDLMVRAIHSTEKMSRARYGACQVYKRVAKLLEIEGTQRIDDLRVTPTPKREINPPSAAKLHAILETCRFATSGKGGGAMWQGWIVAAIAAYGCRPSEAFGLNPKGTGQSAHCWTIKRKNGALVLRTSMCLHAEWPTAFELTDRPELPYSFINKEDYDPEQCKYYVNQTNRWFQTKFPDHTLYDLRHAWAIDAITELNANSVLAAKCMGHDHAVHTKTYHAWMQQDDVERAVLEIQQRQQVNRSD